MKNSETGKPNKGALEQNAQPHMERMPNKTQVENPKGACGICGNEATPREVDAESVAGLSASPIQLTEKPRKLCRPGRDSLGAWNPTSGLSAGHFGFSLIEARHREQVTQVDPTFPLVARECAQSCQYRLEPCPRCPCPAPESPNHMATNLFFFLVHSLRL